MIGLLLLAGASMLLKRRKKKVGRKRLPPRGKSGRFRKRRKKR